MLESDQQATVTARWPLTPIPLAWHTTFNASETAAMVSAAKTWNKFYKESRGFDLFDHGGGRKASTNVNNVCSAAAIVSGTEYTGNVMILKRTDWPGTGSHGSGVIALTTVCSLPIGGEPLKRISNGIIESNYENFFISNKPLPDTESIYLHEMGHLIGMDHSCAINSNSQGVPDCNDLNDSHPYFVAVLFPSIFFPDGQNGEERRVLQANDMGRANCLYEPAQ
ncbi:MAG: hypothetical protein IT285_03870 [Bdellovibrionales bacterium]|nr:hypothetical protein [Bdellovibrionales bacterium]